MPLQDKYYYQAAVAGSLTADDDIRATEATEAAAAVKPVVAAVAAAAAHTVSLQDFCSLSVSCYFE